MASTQSRELRHNSTTKRTRSHSPDGSPAASKRRAGLSRGAESSTASISFSGNPKDRADGAEHSAPITALEEFFCATVAAAELRLDLKSAERERDRADREYNSLRSRFDNFPAIKEQKTAARSRASQKVARVENAIAERAPEERRILSALAGLISQKAPGPGDFNGAQSLADRNDLKFDLQDLKDRIGNLEQDNANDKQLISEHVDEKIEELQTLLATEAQARMDTKDEFSLSQARLQDQIAASIASLRHEFSKAMRVQDQNAKAINNCMDRLQNLEEMQTVIVTQAQARELRKDIATFRETFNVFTKTQPTTPRLSSTAQTWQPVLPGADEEEEGLRRTNGLAPTGHDIASKLGEEVEMLKGIAAKHDRLFNNLTTDEVVKQMVDQMAVMYPDAKHFQVATNQLRTEIRSAHDRINKVSESAIKASSSVSDLESRLPVDLSQTLLHLRNDVGDIKSRTEQCERAVQHGRGKLEELARLEADIAALTSGAKSLTDKVEKVWSLQDQVRESETQEVAQAEPSRPNGI